MAKYQGPIVDVDVHHGWKTPAEVIAYLPKEWREYAQGGARLSGGSSVVAGNTPNSAMRADAFPEDGSFPGSDYPLLKEQLLDRYDYWRGVLTFNVGAHAGLSDRYFAAPLCRAVNDWNAEQWLGRGDERVYSVVLPPAGDPEEAAKEIRRIGKNSKIAGVLLAGTAAYG